MTRRNLCVLVWRPRNLQPFFFRGDSRYEIYLPYISDELVAKGDVWERGWEKDIAFARVFEIPIIFTQRTFAKDFIKERFQVCSYDGDILMTQIFRPIKRPRH